MAENKIKLNSLATPTTNEVKYYQINQSVIEINTLLPYEQIFSMIAWGINHIIDDRPFISAPLKRIFKDFCIIKFYTNIDLDDLDIVGCTPETVYEYYDIIKGSGILDYLKTNLNQEQLEFFDATIEETLKSVVEYRNSAAGLLDRAQMTEADQANSIQEVLKVLDDPNELERVKKMFDLMSLPVTEADLKNQ